MLIAHTELLLKLLIDTRLFLNAEKYFYKVKNALNEGVLEFILIVFFITLQIYSKLECNHYRHYL